MGSAPPKNMSSSTLGSGEGGVGEGIIIALRKGAWQLVQANYKICSNELKFRFVVSIGLNPDYAF